MNEIYGIDMKKLWAWIKEHAWIIVICFAIGYAFGNQYADVRIDLDCKYAKATRIGMNAYACNRIL